ncbi:MAG: hypothetical protein WAM71_12260 [Candidatus Korobacteraceae bacterium]
MAEVILEVNSNVEYAHRVHESAHEEHFEPLDQRHQWVAIAEAIVLAIVAVATAWSGYQAAKWDAYSAQQYSSNANTMIQSQERLTESGQYRLFDVLTFNGWMFAKTRNDRSLTDFYERRFRPEFRIAFNDWIKLDPFHNEQAPAGPGLMPSFKDPLADEAAQLSKQAKVYFEQAVTARDTGDQYVKVTVLLATVLLLTALSQRFKSLSPRVVVVSVALVLLLISAFQLLKLPRT